MDFTNAHLESLLGHIFANKQLLELACTHSSFSNEKGGAHNERLEFIGDAVLGLIAASFLYKKFPEKDEGELSALRARLIEGDACFAFVKKFELQQFLKLGDGEEKLGGRERKRLLANFFEALLGALYLDGGFDATTNFFPGKFLEEIEKIIHSPSTNWKTILQNYTQKEYKTQPIYEKIEALGPAHSKQFIIAVKVDGIEWERGSGSTKKEAESNAACRACRKRGVKE